jgi:hypothetical protein
MSTRRRVKTGILARRPWSAKPDPRQKPNFNPTRIIRALEAKQHPT